MALDFLSRKDKIKGQRNYLSYSFINGLGYSFLAETIIYLMAMNFGAGNLQLGYISSAVYLTGIIIFFVPILFPDVKIIHLFFGAWILRGVVSLLYGFTLVLSDTAAVYLIIAVYTLYCLLRNIAYPLNHVIQSYITKPSERGHFASRVMTVLYSSMMLSRFLSFTALTYFADKEIRGILILLMAGIILNSAASVAITKIPVKRRIEQKSITQIWASFVKYMKEPQKLLMIVLYCCGMSLIVLFSFTIPFLRKELNVPSNLIFIYTTINFLAVIVSSRLIRPFLDKFGSKPILLLVNLNIAVLSLFWIFSSPELGLIFFFCLGFVSMFFIGLVRLLLDRLIVNSIPQDDRVGFSSSLAVVFSFFALASGLSGGYLADLRTIYDLPLVHEYSLSFLLMALLAVLNSLLSLFLNEEGSLPANQFVDVLIHPEKIKTIQNIEKLNRSSSSVKKQMILIELESDQNFLATEEIRSRLKLPTLRDKEMIIRSLFSNPRPELEAELIAEAGDVYSWWRQSAVFALGAYNSDASRKVLRKIFKEKYPYMKSVAAKSMARIGDFSCHDEINSLLKTSSLDVRTYINFVIAVSMIEQDGSYWSTIFNLIRKIPSYRFQQTVLIIGSTRLNFTPPLEDLFYEMNLSENSGFEALFEELIDFDIDEEVLAELNRYLDHADYWAILSFCRNKCRNLQLLEPHSHLQKEILGFKKRVIEPSMAMASLFFSFQLMQEHKRLQNVLDSTRREE